MPDSEKEEVCVMPSPASHGESGCPESIIMERDIHYREGTEPGTHEHERCRLDLYLPCREKNFPVILWLHGGGMTEGSKDALSVRKTGCRFSELGIGFAAANYRLFPHVSYPEYVLDVCDAFAWLCENISSRGGDSRRIFIAGHSAGAYLALMAGLSSEFLASRPFRKNLAGIIEISGQLDCHTTVKREREIDMSLYLVNEAAPLNHINRNAPPVLCLYAEKDFPGREDITLDFISRMEKVSKNTVRAKKIPCKNHYSIVSGIYEQDSSVMNEILSFISDKGCTSK